MADFTIEIAGVPIGVSSLFDSTRDYCRAYFTDEAPQFHVATCREDLDFEQQAAREEAIAEGFRFRNFPDPYLDRTSIQRKIAEALFDRNILVVHGSVIAVDGQGYLFTARSGTGKSTHTRFWRETFGSRAVMVNDDKPFLRMEEQILVCGAPWSGKHGLDTNITVPLKAICILERGPENRIRPIAPEEALPMLLHQSHHPLDESKQHRLEAMVEDLARRIPLWNMECSLDPKAAEVAYAAMSR
jgi:hypothetical protein